MLPSSGVAVVPAPELSAVQGFAIHKPRSLASIGCGAHLPTWPHDGLLTNPFHLCKQFSISVAS